jgi:hypothetical protein
VKSKKKPVSYPVPAWMDDDLKPLAEQLHPLERHAAAERLEKRAAQLRGLCQPEIEPVGTIRVRLRPAAKNAVIAFAEHHGCELGESEAHKIATGAQWILETALTQIGYMSETARNIAHYRDAEGFEDSVLYEQLTTNALSKWKASSDNTAED